VVFPDSKVYESHSIREMFGKYRTFTHTIRAPVKFTEDLLQSMVNIL